MRNSTLQSEPYRYNRYKGTGSTCGWEILPIMAYKGGGGGSAQKGYMYLFQASGITKGRDFTS